MSNIVTRFLCFFLGHRSRSLTSEMVQCQRCGGYRIKGRRKWWPQ
jgi:hypothetical protein